MSELWNKVIKNLLSYSPQKFKRFKSYKAKKREKCKFYFQNTVTKYLKLLRDYLDKVSLIKSIEEYNWNNLLGYSNHLIFTLNWCAYPLMDTILELGVNVSKIKIEGYEACGIFICLRRTSYFDTKDYDLMSKRLNYFKNNIFEGLNLDFIKYYLFPQHTFHPQNFNTLKILLKMGFDLKANINLYNGNPQFNITQMEGYCRYYDEKNEKQNEIPNLLRAMIEIDRDIKGLPFTFVEKNIYHKYLVEQEQRCNNIKQLLNLKYIKDITNLITSYIL